MWLGGGFVMVVWIGGVWVIQKWWVASMLTFCLLMEGNFLMWYANFYYSNYQLCNLYLPISKTEKLTHCFPLLCHAVGLFIFAFLFDILSTWSSCQYRENAWVVTIIWPCFSYFNLWYQSTKKIYFLTKLNPFAGGLRLFLWMLFWFWVAYQDH